MINYTVDIHKNSLEMSVSIDIPSEIIPSDKKEILLELPKWVPGDYEFEAYGRDVFSVQAKNALGKNLEVKRKGFNAYLVKTDGESVTVTYQASCYEPDLGDALGLIDSCFREFALAIAHHLIRIGANAEGFKSPNASNPKIPAPQSYFYE